MFHILNWSHWKSSKAVILVRDKTGTQSGKCSQYESKNEIKGLAFPQIYTTLNYTKAITIKLKQGEWGECNGQSIKTISKVKNLD